MRKETKKEKNKKAIFIFLVFIALLSAVLSIYLAIEKRPLAKLVFNVSFGVQDKKLGIFADKTANTINFGIVPPKSEVSRNLIIGNDFNQDILLKIKESDNLRGLLEFERKVFLKKNSKVEIPIKLNVSTLSNGNYSGKIYVFYFRA